MESGVYTLKIIRVIRARKQPDKLAVNPYNIPNMMKTLIHTLLPAALLLLTATACEDTLTTPAATIGHGDGPTLTLVLDNNEEKAGTRSTLNDGAPVNHVETVRILVFKGTGDDATYVGDEVYADNATAINWPTTEDGKEKLDKITYQMNYAFVEGETYTLLGVGMDSHTDETITEPEEWNDVYDISLKKDETKLSEAYATLKADKTKEYIARHDFYTGTTTFTHEGKNTHIDDLLMKRRVAGVMLYVNEIPADLPHNNTNYRTTRVDLKLGRTQKKSVLLYRNFLAENWTEPEGEDLTDGQVLLSIDLSELNYEDKEDAQGFYTIDNTDKGLQNGALKAACYMLPLNVPTGNAADYKTFTVEIYGVENSDGQGSIATENGDGTTTSKTPELLKSFTVEQRDDDGKSVTSFPIRSNYLYSIGKYNPAEGVDEPISLSGDPIYLEVLPFQTLEVNHEFGEARVQALFNPDFDEEYIFNCMNEVIPIKILPPLTTIRNRVKSIRIGIVDKDHTTVKDQNGKEVTETEEYYNNWLYVEANSNNTTIYRKDLDITELVKNQEGEIKLLMLDYARPRKEWGWNIDGDDTQWIGDNTVVNKINNDIRYTDIYLYTDLEWDQNGDGTISENEKSTRTDVLRIRQYNTITVYWKGWTDKDNIAFCGFSRYDYKESSNDGMNQETTTFGWGFQGSTNPTIYLLTSPVPGTTGSLNIGAENLNGILRSISFDDSWEACAINRSIHPFKKVKQDGSLTEEPVLPITDDNHNTKIGWYLPAQFELQGFFNMCAGNGMTATELIQSNIIENENYWSSSLKDHPTDKETITCILNVHTDSGDRGYEAVSKVRQSNAYHIRQARKFSDYEGYGGQW